LPTLVESQLSIKQIDMGLEPPIRESKISEAFVDAALSGFPDQRMLQPFLGDVIMQTKAIAVSVQKAFNTEQESQFKSVNLKDVYISLGIKKPFTDWAKAKINAYEMQEGVDFVHFRVKPLGGTKPTSEYHVSLDVAKRIAVDSQTPKGEELRQYLTSFEAAAVQTLPEEALDLVKANIETNRLVRDTSTSLMKAMGVLQEEHQNLLGAALCMKRTIEDTKENVRAFDLLCHTEEGNLCISDAAKHLKVGPKVLMSWMLENKWLMRRAKGTSGEKGFSAYQNKITSGLLEHVSEFVTRKDGSTVMSHKIVVTEKGLVALAKTM
jgi:phage anti-repressor protein/phage antirepressor YoqD-like protein